MSISYNNKEIHSFVAKYSNKIANALAIPHGIIGNEIVWATSFSFALKCKIIGFKLSNCPDLGYTYPKSFLTNSKKWYQKQKRIV